ncbi:endo-1,4-beta-xylanase 5-like [Argentina anserina]|uniref:endo-1,4-beta-xylanase 5-like n=1 Tax=Argentina anserina TaxID=57926 RepID=UPI0021765EB6|nr:endo-1,4-beta-xylanase 5-like [Potentilla anserina]
MIKMFKEACTNLLLACIFLYFGHGTSAPTYNYTTTTKCLKEPLGTSYGGGIIVNPEFNHNIEGWKAFGQGKIRERISQDGNRFLVAHSRKNASDSFSQKVQVEQAKLYTFSASVQVSEGSEVVAVVFKFPTGENIRAGDVIAAHGCWTLLKGGIVANFTSSVEILFESKNISLEIWVDNVSLQPFTKEEWKSHQDKSITEVRKSKVSLQVTQANKAPLTGARVSIKQTKSDFPFGCGMNHNILTSTDYQNWFASRFRYTTFTNEMKWYSNEKIQGHENYTIADGMLKFAKENGISIRGHNVFWDDPKMQPGWVNSTLSSEQLRTASAERINSVVCRYKGQLIAWDVMNENLHFRFFEDKLGENASAAFYYTAQQLDPGTMMFLNEYNTMEYSSDEASSPANYMKKLEEILSYPGNANLTAGIGLQGHFGSGQPNLAYMRSVLDFLGAPGYPIWLTEVSVGIGPNQAQYLEEVLREGYSHPAVQGIIMFVGPITAGFNETTLVDNNFNNTPAGDVVDKLIAEWKTGPLELTTDDQGYINVSLFHGDYEVTAEDNVGSSAATLGFKVTKDEPQAFVQVQIDT